MVVGVIWLFIASGCVILLTRSLRSLVRDITEPQAIKPYHTHKHYVTCLLHAYMNLRKPIKNNYVTCLLYDI